MQTRIVLVHRWPPARLCTRGPSERQLHPDTQADGGGSLRDSSNQKLPPPDGFLRAALNRTGGCSTVPSKQLSTPFNVTGEAAKSTSLHSRQQSQGLAAVLPRRSGCQSGAQPRLLCCLWNSRAAVLAVLQKRGKKLFQNISHT